MNVAFIFIILIIAIGAALCFIKVIEAMFRCCSHPERHATFVRNIYGQEIIDLNFVRSEWKAKWWPWRLYHDKLYHKDYE